MTVLKWLGIGLAAVLILLLGVGFMLPTQVHVERSIVIERPQATVFTVLSDLKQFNKFSPWAERDPDADYTYEGDAGTGQKMTWRSEKEDLGAGSQEIIEATPYSQVKTRLVFGENGEMGTGTATFILAEDEKGTKVTWAFDYDTGAAPWNRYMGLMMDRMLGPDYEKGLEKLKVYAESLPAADFSGLDIQFTEVAPVTIAYVSVKVANEAEAVSKAYADSYQAIGTVLKEQDLEPTDMPMGINTSSSKNELAFDAAMPVPDGVKAPQEGPVKIGQSYSGKALRVVHKGPYAGLGATFEKVEAYMAARGLEEGGRSWEHYVTDPGEVPEAELVTHIYVPVKLK